MFRGVYLLLLLGLTDATIDKGMGDWNLLLKFPNNLEVLMIDCVKATVTKENKVAKCTCDGEPVDFEVVRVIVYPFTFTYMTEATTELANQTHIIKEVEDPKDVEKYLKWSCSCQNHEDTRPMVVRFIGDEYVVVYDKRQYNTVYTEKDPNTALMLGRTMPTITKLREVVKSDEELRGREAGIHCPTLKYY